MSIPVFFNPILAHSDSLGFFLFSLLLIMSVGSWFFIAIKAWQAWKHRYLSKKFLTRFWDAPDLENASRQLPEHANDDPFSHLAYHAFNAMRHHAAHGKQRLEEAGSAHEFLTRAMRRVIDEETAKLEWGLTMLGSIASTAPFVGLFGTVWGVYHALTNIGQQGQIGLDQIAGPVGESLIMTGLGLAVAIPAVLAYNDCVRNNRLLLAQLDGFAHDLFALLTTGATIQFTHQPAEAEMTPLYRLAGEG